jgi:hypothetical protein
METILLVCSFFLGLMFTEACGNRQPVISTPEQSDGVLKGITLSPRSFQSADFTDFFKKAKQAGNFVSWAGDWKELNNTANGAKVVAELESTYNYTPLIELQFFTQSTGRLLRPLDDSTKQAYKDSAVALVDKYKLQYLGIGIEVNTLYVKSPADFDAFVQLYENVYDAVKAKSPDTKVFTIFQLEMMKGLNGGLFGGSNEPAKAQWSLLDKFPKSDIITFTTYPSLIYGAPSEIPFDYYDEIRTHTKKSVAFTEIGWHSEADPAGWESSEAEQAEFVVTFFNRIRDLNNELAIWSFMYDQDTLAPFRSMGLHSKDGTAKPAWSEWVSSR